MPSVRTTVIENISSRIAGILGDTVQVDPGLPSKTVLREHVYVPRVTGTRDFVFIQAGRKTVDDQFTITFLFMAAPKGYTALEAGARCEEMTDALLDVLALSPGLDNDIPEIIDIQPGTFDGPEIENTNEGVVAFIRADVDVHVRYDS